MIVTREMVRQKVVGLLRPTLETGFRTRWPMFPEVDVSVDKTPYVNVDIVYADASQAGMGPEGKDRMYGTIVVEFNFKQGDIAAIPLVNNALDSVHRLLSRKDTMYPVRTGVTKQVSPSSFVDGWDREGLVTPFWFDTSI